MTYTVTLSEPAEAEAESIMLRLAGVSPDFAGRWYDGLLTAIESLDTFPRRCPVAPENADFPDFEVRQLIYRRSRVIYRILYCVVDPDLVHILHIRPAAPSRSDFEADSE